MQQNACIAISVYILEEKVSAVCTKPHFLRCLPCLRHSKAFHNALIGSVITEGNCDGASSDVQNLPCQGISLH